MKKSEIISAVGVIAEYNPFHNGHAYHIARAKELSGAEYCVVVMSGDFVQRGAPAIYQKNIRTAMALSCGADLVLEMPAVFATSSAEDFASCGVSLLDKLGIISHLCFGSECGDMNWLSQVSDLLIQEPNAYTGLLKERLRLGFTYPQAREYAFSNYLAETGVMSEENTGTILGSPNNILGIEYCKALSKRRSTITPITIKRSGSDYHDLDFHQGFGSASAIRQAIQHQSETQELNSQIPKQIHCILADSKPLFSEDFSALLNVTLLRLAESSQNLCDYADVSKDLEARILSTVLDFSSFEERIQRLKTKQYTYTRISRALLHLMLGIKKSDCALGYALDYAPYARVLGFKKNCVSLLTQIKQLGEIPLITKTADAKHVLSADGFQMLQQDFQCTHIYDAIWSSRYQQSVLNEFSRQIVMI